jgi:hypothetical protein
MELKDSGGRTQFETGAVRDLQDSKGRCDLLPLDIIGEELNCPVFQAIHEYIYYGNPKVLWTAMELFRQYITNRRGIQDLTTVKMLLSVSEHYERGAHKYAERNWELGIPLHNYISSGVRHLLKVVDGWDDEPHEDAFVWNMLGAIWTQKHHPELIDLPFARKDTRDEPVNRGIDSTTENTGRCS